MPSAFPFVELTDPNGKRPVMIDPASVIMVRQAENCGQVAISKQGTIFWQNFEEDVREAADTIARARDNACAAMLTGLVDAGDKLDNLTKLMLERILPVAKEAAAKTLDEKLAVYASAAGDEHNKKPAKQTTKKAKAPK